jgi:hypothetical protein
MRLVRTEAETPGRGTLLLLARLLLLLRCWLWSRLLLLVVGWLLWLLILYVCRIMLARRVLGILVVVLRSLSRGRGKRMAGVMR